MIRLRALNEESSEESEGEEEIPLITREAQEQTAFAQYNEALAMLKEKNFESARTVFQALLENSFLVEITKQDGTEGLGHPALVLKYSCLKNMGTLLEKQGELQEALQHYLKAAELDGSDVTLWYRVGTVALRVIEYELACDAFLEGLRCSPRHWPCLDNIVTILYVLNEYVPCLLYIARAFELDPGFAKGIVFRDKILAEQPSIINDFNLYCKGYDLGCLDTKCDDETTKEFIEEALEMREKKRKHCGDVFTPEPIKTITLVQEILAKTWLALGESLVHLHQHIDANRNIRHFCCPVDLEATAGTMNHTEKDVKPPDDAMDVGQAASEDMKTGGNEEATSLAAGEEDGAADARGTPEGDDAKSRKRRRSSLSFLEQWMWGGKRRSARVRSTVKREAEREDGNLQEALRRLVPQSLLPNVMKDAKQKELEAMKLTENSLDTMDLYKLFDRRESTEGRSDDNHRSAVVSPRKENEEMAKILTDEGYFGSEKENNDVREFILSNTQHDIIDLLISYVKLLSNKWQLLWPAALTGIFIQAYQCMRQHVYHPSPFSSDEDADWLREDACITLLYGELFLDRLLQNKTGYEGQIPAESIGQLVLLSGQECLFGGEHLKYMLRLYWLKAHLFMNQGNSEIAMQSLHTILGYLDERCDTDNMEKVFLPNCKHHNYISREVAQKLLTALTRNQSLYEVQQLYDQQQYDKLVEILQETFHYSQQSQLPSALINNNACPDRATQLAMLMDALWQLKRYQDCFFWGEACCNEALHKYLNSEDKEQSKWASTVEKLLSGLESCVNKAGLSVIDTMVNNRLARLVQNLTHIVCHQLDAPETAVEMPIESINPWILLQQILQQKEEKGKLTSASDEDEEREVVRSGELPGYISVLFTAHDFLGRRSWCCSSEGALLLHTMDVVIPRLKDGRFISVRDKLHQGLEQVFFCLYAHPNKKTKARYLQDHGVPQIPLTWARGMQLYQFYLPDELPEFDSYRVTSITSDVECLLKRIATLVPSQYSPAHLVEKVMAYIDGTSPIFPVLGDARSQLPRSMSAIYYLLADYYFKVNEWGKAIRHYLLDVCVNPVRIDSWAGMALARGSQLETKLNSCEPLKSEMEFLRQASAAQRCFQRALDIEASHSLMWIEYGSFVYMVHSFCSRLLKQETDSLSLEMFEILENRKEMMLDIAVKCFTTASKIWYAAGEDGGIQDERWLHQYMLGKVAEKRDHDPGVFLGHFAKACEHLHQTRASYARRISYNNPQNLAVEVLEVYYRIHACILKYLEQNEGRKLEEDTRELFQKLLKDAAEGPFMASSSRETEGKTESDEEQKKRQLIESIDCVEDGPFMKKARLDLPLDICVMEDVIDVMEGLITRVVEGDSRRDQTWCAVETPDNVNVNPVRNKDDGVEVIILDDTLHKTFESPNEVNMQVDPLSIDTENVVIKKEPVTEMVDCKELVVHELYTEANLDDIDLAMEVVEEIVVEEVIVDDELDQTSNSENKANIKDECEEQITELKMLEASSDVRDVVGSSKVEASGDKCPQLSNTKMETGRYNGNGGDADDECEDDDDDNDGDDEFDEYDGDDDDDDDNDEVEEEDDDEAEEEEEGGKGIKRDELHGASDMKLENGAPKLPEQQPETEEMGNMIPEIPINRRSSQETTTSTTTTTTTETSTANSTSSSSDSEGDSSSSNEDSSKSSSNSDSDNANDSNSEEADQAAETITRTTSTALTNKKKSPGPSPAKREDVRKKDNGDELGGNYDHYELVRQCLVALEECVLRFPQHYKSLYRLTHFYFHSKFHRNVPKCQDLLMGTYKCLPMEGRPANASFQGLFAERKNNNFFNGVWRIPVSEIDRPGSFASHMSRCVLLLMEVLREVRDHRMLLELCLQLRRTPEADKKYLRDSEREQLCRQALTLALQALRAKLRDGPITSGLVLEMYRAYLRVQRHLPQKESVFASLLSEAYKQHAKVETAVLDQAIRFCQQELIASRAAARPSNATPAPTTLSQPVITMPPATTGASTIVSTHQQQKAVTPAVKPAVASNHSSIQPPPRSRGRPPNISHITGTNTPLSSKSQSSSSRCNVQKVPPQPLGSIIPPNLSAPTLPYYPFHTLFSDPSLITAAVQSKLPAMLDPQVAALNFLNLHSHVGGYQAEFLRHFSTSTGEVPAPVIPNIPTSQTQKSHGTARSNNSSFVGNKGIQNLPTQQPTQPPSTTLPASISITPLLSTQASVPCSASTSTAPSTKYSNSKTSKSTPSLQQKLQASQALAKSTCSRSSVPNSSSSVPKPNSQISPSVTQLPLTVTTSSYTPPKDQAFFSSQQPKSSSNPNQYLSLLKGGEGMLTAGVSISQVTATPVNTTTTTKSASKLATFRKHSTSSLQDQSNVSKDVTNIAPSFKGSHSDSLKTQSRSDCSSVTKSHDVALRTATTLGSRNQNSGCKLSVTSASGPSILSGQTQMIPISRSQSSAIGQDSSVYKEIQTPPKSSNHFMQWGQMNESAVNKTKSPESKDLNPSSIYKSQSGNKGSRSPGSLRNIGHEITVTPSLSHSASATAAISMLSHLQQQNTELELVTKSKSATLDLPVTIPSSITITPKQQGNPDAGFSRGQQGKQSSAGGDSFRSSKNKFKDTVSITEVGRKVSSGSPGAKRMGAPSAMRQDRQKEEKQDDKHGCAAGDSVEIITLE